MYIQPQNHLTKHFSQFVAILVFAISHRRRGGTRQGHMKLESGSGILVPRLDLPWGILCGYMPPSKRYFEVVSAYVGRLSMWLHKYL